MLMDFLWSLRVVQMVVSRPAFIKTRVVCITEVHSSDLIVFQSALLSLLSLLSALLSLLSLLSLL